MAINNLTDGLYLNADELSLTTYSPMIMNWLHMEPNTFEKRFGKSIFASLGIESAGVQGLFYWNSQNKIIAVCNGKTFTVSTVDAAVTDVTGDTLSTLLPATFAEHTNGNVWIATGGRMVTLASGGTTSFVADADAPTKVSHVCFYDGYIICNNLDSVNQFHWTDILDPTSWTASSYATAEGHPDRIIAIHQFWRELYLFGTRTVEIWQNDGKTPFSRIGGCYIEMGCSAPYTVCLAGGSIFWIDDQRRLIKCDGREPNPISIPFQKDLYGMSDISDGRAAVLTVDAQNLLQFTFPSANKSYLYNYLSNKTVQTGKYNNNTNSFDLDPICCSLDLGYGISIGYTTASLNKDVSTNVNNTAIGTLAWTNPSYSGDGDDSTYASTTATALNDITNYLWCTGFDFSTLPSTALILGIKIILHLRTQYGVTISGNMTDSTAQLIVGNSAIGQNKATGQNMNLTLSGALGDFCYGSYIYGNISDQDPVYSIEYGGETDLWGLQPTAANINSANFGFVFGASCGNYSYSGVGGTVPPFVRLAGIKIYTYYTTTSSTGRVGMFAGDLDKGVIYSLSSSYYDDAGTPIISTLRTGHIDNGTMLRKFCNRLSFKIKKRPSTVAEPNPSLSLKWRDNDANTISPITLSFNDNTVETRLDRFRNGSYITRQYEITHSSQSPICIAGVEEYTTTQVDEESTSSG